MLKYYSSTALASFNCYCYPLQLILPMTFDYFVQQSATDTSSHLTGHVTLNFKQVRSIYLFISNNLVVSII